MKSNKLVYGLVGLLVLVLLVGGIYLALKGKDKNIVNAYQEEESKLGLEKIEALRKENETLSLEYESEKLEEYKILVYKCEDEYKEYIVDYETGEEKEFLDLINDIDKFKEKIGELLELKYPKHIRDKINIDEAFYLMRENEVILYFKDNLELRVNFNEIKDYLSFKPVLDSEYQNEDGYNYTSDKKSIALTIDDGPNSKYNSRILQILSDNKAHATFFMAGNMMNACQSCVVNTYKSGNEIGSHTYEHMNIRKNSLDKVLESLEKTNSIYKQLTGDDIKLLRPPYGAYNDTNKEELNIPFILWNLDTEDWKYRDKDHIVNYFLNNASDGSIILVHENYAETVEALEEVLPIIYDRGFQVVSVSELAKLKGVEISAHEAYRSFK